MKEGRDESQGESRERGRGGEPARREMMNHYKGKEKSKWKWGTTKEHSGLPLDRFESPDKSEGRAEGDERERRLVDEFIDFIGF